MSANTKFETLGDVVRRGLNLAIECQCGHVGIVEAARMERWYACHQWDRRLHKLRDHLYCLGCGGRPPAARLRVSGQQPTAPNRFPVNEQQWERLVRGLRG